MNNDEPYSDILLEWEGSAPIFDDITSVKAQDGDDLEVRVFAKPSLRMDDLPDMIGRFSTALGFAATLNATTNLYAKGILAFCIVALINPLKVKVLAGRGIDPLLDEAELDIETGERKIEMRKFLTHCKNTDIPSSFIGWLEKNGFAYTTDTHLVFRNNFKHGKIISRI